MNELDPGQDCHEKAGGSVPLKSRIESVSIIMPTYNEAGHISELIVAVVGSVRSTGVADIEVIVVDDDSPDKTWQLAGETICPDAEIRVIRRMSNRGVTNSMIEGVAAARKKVLVWFDCDFSHPPEYIPRLLEAIANGCDVAVNSRYVPGGGEERVGEGGGLQMGLSRLLNGFARLMLKSSFHDYTSGFVAVRKDVVAKICFRGEYHEYFIGFIYSALCLEGCRVCEIPYLMAPRKSGESKTGRCLADFFWKGWRYLITIVRCRFNPPATFGVTRET
jgi:glycosyltransferase involved in cell wall biosynthesis